MNDYKKHDEEGQEQDRKQEKSEVCTYPALAPTQFLQMMVVYVCCFLHEAGAVDENA